MTFFFFFFCIPESLPSRAAEKGVAMSGKGNAGAQLRVVISEAVDHLIVSSVLHHEPPPQRSPLCVLAVLPGWREELSVNNGGGWTNASMKICGQFGDAEGTKWSGVHTAVHYRAPPKHQSWAQERQGSAAVSVRRATQHVQIVITASACAVCNTSGPQHPGRGPVPIRGSFGTKPHGRNHSLPSD